MFGNLRNIIKPKNQVIKIISKNKNKVTQIPTKEFKYQPPDNKLPHKDFIKIFRWKSY